MSKKQQLSLYLYEDEVENLEYEKPESMALSVYMSRKIENFLSGKEFELEHNKLKMDVILYKFEDTCCYFLPKRVIDFFYVSLALNENSLISINIHEPDVGLIGVIPLNLNVPSHRNFILGFVECTHLFLFQSCCPSVAYCDGLKGFDEQYWNKEGRVLKEGTDYDKYSHTIEQYVKKVEELKKKLKKELKRDIPVQIPRVLPYPGSLPYEIFLDKIIFPKFSKL